MTHSRKAFKLRDICIKITDGSHNPPKGIENSEYLMLSSKNVFDDLITLNNPRYLTKNDFEQENRRTDVNVGDVLLTIVGTIGRVAVVGENLPKFTLQRSVAVLKPNKNIVDSRFIMYSLQNILEKITGEARGVAQKGLYLNQIKNIELLLPPIEDQKRISTDLDETFGKIERIRNNAQNKLKKLDELKKSILNQACSEDI